LHLVELFSSVQGEGPHVGRTTLFVRFGACDLRCRWCDSPGTWREARSCRIQLERGRPGSECVDNPLSVEQVVAALERLEVSRHGFVSLTGGEPLLQPEGVRALARALRGRGPRILLETHGLAAEALARVLDGVDVVSMDWKLASDVRRAGEAREAPSRDFHDEHERFLRIALAAEEVVVKIVVTASSLDREIDEACARIARVAPATPLVLQPVTPYGKVRERPSAERMLELLTRAEARLSDVRVLPQTHPIYGAP
jgi:organic radical activating enzyme